MKLYQDKASTTTKYIAKRSLNKVLFKWGLGGWSVIKSPISKSAVNKTNTILMIENITRAIRLFPLLGLPVIANTASEK
jgi:hypothetical protein